VSEESRCLEQGEHCTFCGLVPENTGDLVEIHTYKYHDWLCADCEYDMDSKFMESDYEEFEDWFNAQTTERTFVLDLTEEDERLLVEAAKAEGLSLSDFLVKLLINQAEKMLPQSKQNEVL
jgi:hypothetical protein